jgi:uncharacterized protein with HEPN domain
MKDDSLYLVDMLEFSRKIQLRVAATSREAFDQNEDLQFALTHLLQNVGEAARLVSPETRSRFPGIPWNQITGMRHKIVHEYWRIQFDIVWATAMSISELVDGLAPVVDPIIQKAKEDLENP